MKTKRIKCAHLQYTKVDGWCHLGIVPLPKDAREVSEGIYKIDGIEGKEMWVDIEYSWQKPRPSK